MISQTLTSEEIKTKVLNFLSKVWNERYIDLKKCLIQVLLISIVLLSTDRLTPGVWGSKTRASEGVEEYNRETLWANGAWDQLTCTHTTYWGGEWEDGLLYCLTNLWNKFWLILQLFTCSAMSEESKTGDGSRRGVWAIPADSRECLESPAGNSRARPQPIPTTVGQDQTWGFTDTDNSNQLHCNRAALIQLQHLYLWLLLTQCCLCFMSLHLLKSPKICV